MSSELRKIRFEIEQERRLLNKQIARDALHPVLGPLQLQLPMAGYRVNASVPVRNESGETDDVKVLSNELERLRGLTAKQIARMALYPIGPVPSGTDDTPWCGRQANKLYLQSGQFSSTLKTSEGVLPGNTNDISWDGTNTPWLNSAVVGMVLTLQSGQFSSTVKASLDISAATSFAFGMSWDGTDTPLCQDKVTPAETYLTLHSGQFTSTIKTSISVVAINLSSGGISWDGTNTPWSGTDLGDDKIYLQSGQFTSTIKDSLLVLGGFGPPSISFDGTDTPVVSGVFLKLISGQFSSTVKTSQSVTAIDNNPSGINTNKRTTG